MQNSESGIPLLTEILQAPPASEPGAWPAMEPVRPPTDAAADDTAPAGDMAAQSTSMQRLPAQNLDAAALARIEEEVSEAVLGSLLGQLDDVLESRIRDQLADVLQTAVDGLACQLRAGLKQALGESISLAVAAEMDRRRISENKNFP